MKIQIEKTFMKSYGSLPKEIQDRFQQKLSLLMENFQHPSLRAKKMQGKEDIWEASISDNYRITFKIKGDTIILRKIGTHDKTLRNP
jgi:addiction module RelE/StbE family toxin